MNRKSRVVVTAGPTVEPLDAVRVLANRSSGRMGYAVARAAARRGHRVTLVSGLVDLVPPAGVRLVRVRTAREMLAACRRAFVAADALVMAAAVADYRPARVSRVKRHKGAWSAVLHLARNPDILATLCRRKGDRLAVGFALENALSDRAGMAKLRRKGCDAVVMNALPSLGGEVFRGRLLAPGSRPVPLGPSKGKAAARIVAWIERSLALKSR